MSTQPRITREEERRLNLRTLVIASAASATAAIATSQFWIAGTPIAAAVTPLIVAFVSEMLHRPTERIVQRFTVETQALPPQPPTEPLPQADRPATVYRQPGRRLPLRGIAITAGLAFVIGMAVLTVPELIAGQSIGKGNGATSYFGGNRNDRREQPREQPAPAVTAPPVTEQQTVPTTTQTTPQAPPTTPTQTTPAQTTPTQTTPAP